MKTNEEIKKILVEMGGNLWEKNGKSRIYFNASKLGLTITKYNTGNISSACLDGESISNCEANRILGSKFYYDLLTNKFVFEPNGTHAKYVSLVNDFVKSAELAIQ